MSYAIIRNEKYTKEKMLQISPHNERQKKSYSNKNIDKNKTYLNYHLKKPIENTYLKEFKRLKEENNLKGQIHKNSIYVCEMLITSDKEFFNNIGEKETKRYFQESFNFISQYKGLGQENIISAVVHLDEETPHMHLVFIPVVNSVDKNKNKIRKISSSEFWKEKNSYTILQDRFYEFIKSKNFDLERGNKEKKQKHFKIEDLKILTNFYETKNLKSELEKEKSNIIKYNNMKDFANNETFSMKSVEENLLYPVITENKLLVEENHNLKIELSKAKNAISYYEDLENTNKQLEHNIKLKDIEINSMYEIIRDLSNKYDKLIKWIKNKFGVDKSKFDEKIK